MNENQTFVSKIAIDYSRDSLMSDMGVATWKDRYRYSTEKSPQETIARVAAAFCGGDLDFANRIYSYVSKQWFIFSTPIYSNGGTDRGLPISCFLNYVDDSLKGITEHFVENAMLSSYGGGIGSYWGDCRSVGQKTSRGAECSGVIPFLKVVDSEVLAFNQGSNRKASNAVYMDVSHPEILEFIGLRKPTGGDANRKCINLHNAVNIPDSFMKIIEECMVNDKADSSWKLIDPHSKEVVTIVDAKEIWQAIIETRMQTGEPMIHFIDTTNRALPKEQKEKGLIVHQSNLCTEITLPTSRERTAVCCLSSVNVATFDEWRKDPQFLTDLVRFLDNVIEVYINTAPEEHKKAVFSAEKERSLGIGAMGFQTYLQSKGVSMEDMQAMGINYTVFKHLYDGCLEGSKILATERGEPDDIKGSGRRNAHLMAVAPNASSSILCGNVSPSVEPHLANAYTHRTLSGSFLVKNSELVKVLEKYGKNTDEIWTNILVNEGSVAGLDFLSEKEKSVFKTAKEIDQSYLVELASVRQEFICQAQSINLFFYPDEHIKKISDVHFEAWKKGLKTLYYLRTKGSKSTEVISSKKKTDLKADNTDCIFCEG